jgi:xanthine dehydrogenase YagR molybdenum-binding subunit
MSDSNSFDPTALQVSRREAIAGGLAVAGGLAARPATAQQDVLPVPDTVAKAAQPQDPLIKSPGQIGKARSRRDGAQKVKGLAKYAAEHRFPNMTYAALVYSTIARGSIASISKAAAAAAPGVVFIMTHENAPRMQAPESFLATPTGASGSSHPVMQDAQVYWNGQPVAVVLAATQEQADHAATLIDVTYNRVEAVTSLQAAKRAGTVRASFAGHDLYVAKGDAEAALANSAVSVDIKYVTPPHHHNQIEPHAMTVAWRGDQLRVHDCSQGIKLSAATLAKVFGIDPAKVHLTSEFIGGSFGGKTLWQYHIIATAAAKASGRPVRMNVTREGVFRLCGGRASTEQRVALGADRLGRLKALVHTGVTPKIKQNAMTEPFIEATQRLYRADATLLEVRSTDMDTLANTFMRAPGSAVGSFAVETAMDELAEKLGMDPIELRIRNEPTVDPTTGKSFSQRALLQAYSMGAERFGWTPRNGQRAGRREGDWLVGTGVATAYYPYNRFPGGAARVTLDNKGRLLVELAGHENGVGMTTTTSILAAERFGVDFDHVDVRYGDIRLPGSHPAGGSQQTASIGAAMLAAHKAMLHELAKAAPTGSPWFGKSADQLITLRGGLALAEDPKAHIGFRQLLHGAGRPSITVQADSAAATEGEAWSMHSYGAVFCEVRVNVDTGELRVSRVTGVYDCGKIINAKTAASQFRGGIIMSLGLAMMEEALIDERTGRVMNASMTDYHMPVHLDVPSIDVAWTDIPDPHSPTGARGVGEISMNGASAALANAVYDATGKRIRQLPITLDKLL